MLTRNTQIKCLNPDCNIHFHPKIEKQVYHHKKCYYAHLKIKKNQSKNSFPRFICPDCGVEISLDFSPCNNKSRWLDWKCPHCGYVNETSLYYKSLMYVEKELKKEEKEEIIELINQKKTTILQTVLNWWTSLRY